MKVLFVSPHPDDVEIGCGGLVHRLAQQHVECHLAVCTGPGDLQMMHSGQVVKFEQRVAEQQRAAQRLGMANVHWLNLGKAGRFDQVAQMAFVTAFDKLFPAFDAIVIPLPSYNDDHLRVWEAAMASCRPGKLDSVNVYAYDQQASHCVGAQLPGREFGRIYVPISEEALQAKQEALREHVSQMQGREETIYGPRGMAVSAASRGLECGAPLAEMLYLIRSRVADPRKLL